MTAQVPSAEAGGGPIRTRLDSLQAARGLAALAVVAVHIASPTGFEYKLSGPHWTGWMYPGGLLGVDLFFVISGFIMVATTSHVEGSPGAARLFVLRRVLRVYPAYLVATALIFAVFVVRPDLVNSNQATPPDPLASFLLLPQAGLPLLLVGWTLVHEMYFYLVYAGAMLFSPRYRPIVLAAWGGVIIVLHELSGPDSSPWLAVAGSLLNLEFLLGAGLALLLHRRRGPNPWALALIGAALLTFFGERLLSGHELSEGYARVFGLAGGLAACLGCAVVLEARGKWHHPPVVAALGDQSYSLYLVHVPVLSATGLLLGEQSAPVPHALSILCGLAACLAGGVVFYRAVEQPAARLARRLLAKSSRPAAARSPLDERSDPRI